jgi:hypothetical protein
VGYFASAGAGRGIPYKNVHKGYATGGPPATRAGRGVSAHWRNIW